MEKQLVEGLNEAAKAIFENNKAKGFWDKPRNVGELLMLVVSQLGEAMEAHRKGKLSRIQLFNHTMGTYIGLDENDELLDSLAEEKSILFEAYLKDTFEDEIADAIIRLLDLSAGLGIDIENHIRLKVEYNKSRPKLHGKLY